jgi:prepilin-type N-terminal cleavage/methylation domain-containing protein
MISMPRTQRAFTLTEVLFALFLVTITALIMASALPMGHHSRQRADRRIRAAELAQRELEEMRNVGYPNLTPAQLYASGLLDSTGHATNGYPFTNVHSAQGDAVANVLPSGQAWAEVTQIGLDTRSLIITVQWNENGQIRTVKMATLVGNL